MPILPGYSTVLFPFIVEIVMNKIYLLETFFFRKTTVEEVVLKSSSPVLMLCHFIRPLQMFNIGES